MKFETISSFQTKFEDNKLIQFLFKHGFNVESPMLFNWKYLKILQNLFPQCNPKGQKLISDMIMNNSYKLQIKQLWNTLNDFQLGLILVNLLSTCVTNDNQRSHYFKEVLNNGSIQTLTDSKLLNFHKLKKVTCFPNVEQIQGTLLLSEGFLQIIYNKTYIWRTNPDTNKIELIVELNRKDIEISKNLRNNLVIKVCEGSKASDFKCNSILLENFKRARTFLIEFTDNSECTSLFYNINNVAKISEVKTFLLLNHIEEGPSEEENEEAEHDGSISNTNSSTSISEELSIHVSTEESSSVQGTKISVNPSVNPLLTPDQSEINMLKTDEWDFPMSSQNLAGTTKPNKEHSSEIFDNNNIEQSPLVLVQKRKMIRETTKTLERLKKEFNLIEDQIPSHINSPTKNPDTNLTSSFMITNVNEKPKENTKLKLTNILAKENTQKLKAPSIKTVHPSIGKKDIKVLNTIFGPNSKTKRKTPIKKQQKLKNFKPLVTIASSQEGPALRTRGNKKKIGGNPAKASVTTFPKGEIYAIESQPSPEILSPKRTEVLNGTKRNADKLENESSKIVTKKLKTPISDLSAVSMESTKCCIPKVQVHGTDPEPVQPQSKNDTLQENNNTTAMNSTTILGGSAHNSFVENIQNSFTAGLQEQIFNSVTNFSMDLGKKIEIINKELNNRIMKQLSEKYQRLFTEMQKSFQNDAEEMIKFMGELKDMLHLSEQELVNVIRSRKFET